MNTKVLQEGEQNEKSPDRLDQLYWQSNIIVEIFENSKTHTVIFCHFPLLKVRQSHTAFTKVSEIMAR